MEQQKKFLANGPKGRKEAVIHSWSQRGIFIRSTIFIHPKEERDTRPHPRFEMKTEYTKFPNWFFLFSPKRFLKTYKTLFHRNVWKMIFALVKTDVCWWIPRRKKSPKWGFFPPPPAASSHRLMPEKRSRAAASLKKRNGGPLAPSSSFVSRFW